MGLPPFSEAEFWNTVLWAPLGQEVFAFLKHKARGDQSVFARVARIATANAARAGVRVDQAELRRLLSEDRLLQALVARDLDELDRALDSAVQSPAGWTADQARTVLVAALLVGLDGELPADRKLEFAAHRNLIRRLDQLRGQLDRLGAQSQAGVNLLAGLDARVDRLAEEVSRQTRPFGYRDSYDAQVDAFEAEHVPRLKDRERDLDDLTRRILQQPGYLAVEAPMYAGKTALFAALHRRLVDRGYAVVIFYIQRDYEDTAASFLPKAISQLLNLLERYDARLYGEGVATSFDARRTQLAHLWQQATHQIDRSLVLLIDALDEQWYRPSKRVAEEPPISHLLPVDVGPHGRVVVSSRLNPDIASVVPAAHPLASLPRDRRFLLVPSPHATVRRRKIQAELDRQLACGNPKAEYAIGMYAIGTAPLSDDDLADLLRLTPGQVRAMREPIAASLLWLHDLDGVDRFQLGHPAQRQHVRGHLGRRGIAQLIDEVLAWADRYGNATPPWPDDTPVFLRDHLHTFIGAMTRPDRAQHLLGLITDARRALFQRTRHSLDGFVATLDASASALADGPPTPEQLAGYLWLLGHRAETTATAVTIPISVLVALARVGHDAQALGIASTLPAADVRADALARIAAASAEAGQLLQADRAAEQAARTVAEVDQLRRGEVLIKVASTLTQAEATRHARQAAEQFRQDALEFDDPWLRVVTLAEAASALAKAGMVEQGRQTAKQARNAAVEIHDRSQRALALGYVVIALTQAGVAKQGQQDAEQTWQAAQQDWQAAQQADQIPYRQHQQLSELWALTGAEVAVAFAKAGMVVQARRLATQADSWYRAECEVAVALARAGMVEQARQTAEQAWPDPDALDWPLRFQRARALTEIAVALAKAGMVEQARQTAEQAYQDADRIPTVWGGVEALTRVAVAFAHAGEVELARQAATKVHDSSHRAQALADIAAALAEAGMIEQARQTVTEIDPPQWRSEALGHVAVALARAGMIKEGHQTAMSARQEAEVAGQLAVRVDEPRWWAETLAEVAVAYAQARMIKEAQQTAMYARHIADKVTDGWEVHVFTKVAVALARAGMVHQAQQTADKVGHWRGQALAEVAVALAQVGAVEQARQTAEQAHQDAVNDHHAGTLAEVLADVAVAFTEAGAVEQARQTAEQARQIAVNMDDYDWHAEGHTKVAVALARAGMVEQARQAITKILDQRQRLEALGEIAVAFAQAGAVEQARQTAEQAHQDAVNDHDAEALTEALAKIAVALAQVGAVEQARQTAEQARQAAAGINFLSSRAEMLAEVANAFLRGGGREHIAGTVRVLQDALGMEDPKAQRALFRKICLANFALFPAALGPLVTRFLVPDQVTLQADRLVQAGGLNQ